MLRRIGLRRMDVMVTAPPPAEPSVALPASEETPEAPSEVHPRKWFTWKRALLGVALVMVVSGGVAYSQKDRVSAQTAELLRSTIGDENTARVEGWVFKIEDRVERLKYRVLGGDSDPFAIPDVQVQFIPRAPARELTYLVGAPRTGGQTLTAEALGPLPLQLPATKVLLSDPLPGEGAWATTGLPRNTPADTLMAKTFIRPDKTRPYATVGILVIDQRRMHLKMVGGTAHPGGDRGVKGPGTVPKEDYSTLLVAFNGGFQGPHGNFGMVANGKEYRPLRAGLATICVMANGTMKMGQYGRDISWEPGMEACRQNAVLLVDSGEVSKRTAEGNDTWGYVNVDSSEFITWRSAVGLTKDGNLMIAAGNSLSAETLAKAMQAAGAYMAMQLDINAPYISTGLYYPQPDGTLKVDKFMDSMAASPSSFLGMRERDFFYVVLDESRYR
jgi:hypothetical protein